MVLWFNYTKTVIIRQVQCSYSNHNDSSFTGIRREQSVNRSIVRCMLTLCIGGMRSRGAEGWSEVAWLLWAAWLALHRLCRYALSTISHLGLLLPHLPLPWYCRAKIELYNHDQMQLPAPMQQATAEMHTSQDNGQTAVCWSLESN